jgi:putative component of toxin-antitoxin plasmid stabilization module
MKYKIVKLEKLSGKRASIYSVLMNDKKTTLFDEFLKENGISFKSETKDIFMRLNSIGKEVGARNNFFKDFEGKPGDGICALYDNPNSKLRLYCIKYGTQIIILGGGGFKSKSTKAFQETKKLEDENYLLRKISSQITQRIIDKDIRFTQDGQGFIGNLDFNDDEN